MRFKDTLIAAIQFLTIVPIKTRGNITEKSIADSSIFFPVAGLLQGLLLSFSCMFILELFSVNTTCAFLITIYILTNGGFHLDGLADTFDALSVKSSGDFEKDRQKRLKVMKDGATGAIGVISICLALLLKYLFIRDIFLLEASYKYLVLLLLPVFPKWAMLISTYRRRSAREDGLGRIFIENVRLYHVLFGTVITIIIAFAVFYVFNIFYSTGLNWNLWRFSAFLVSQMASVGFTGLFLMKLFERSFGGVSGDNFGLVHEISEIVFLAVAYIWKP